MMSITDPVPIGGPFRQSLWPSAAVAHPRLFRAARTSRLGTLIATELAAATGIIIAWSIDNGPPPAAQLGLAGILASLGLADAQIAQRSARTRHYPLAGGPVALIPVWAFAAALLLHPLLSTSVAIVLHLDLRWQSRNAGVPLHRTVSQVATAILSCLAVHAVHTAIAPLGWSRAVGVAIAVLCFVATRKALDAAVTALETAEPPAATPFAAGGGISLDIASASAGGVTAAALTINPVLGLLVLPIVLCLHRAVLAHQLADAVDVDAKTGLLTATAWNDRAQHLLLRRAMEEPGAVLILDLDRFKTVNDTCGHLAGDHVLAAVATSLRADVRRCDLIGRFGGEEFVVLLAGRDGGQRDFEAVADSMRQRIAQLRVEVATSDGTLTVIRMTVSIGGALQVTDGTDLRSLLQIADAALYDAKRAGRNTIRMVSADTEPHFRTSEDCPARAFRDESPTSGRATIAANGDR